MIKKPIIYDYNYVLSEKNPGPATVKIEELESYSNKTREIHKQLMEKREIGSLPFYDLPYRKKDISLVKEVAEDVKKSMGEKLENILVVGIGGSSLGGIALTKSLLHPFHNLVPQEIRKAPRIFFAENIDADEVKGLFDVIDPEKTVVNIISKSGNTAEPMANFLLIYKFMKEKIGEDSLKNQIVATTDTQKGTLRKIADDLGLRSLPIPEGVGGRFSVLTPVGLFPAYMAGIDIDTLLEGAALMDKRCKNEDLFKNPAYLNAVIHFHLHRTRNINMAVLMPYSQALSQVSDWYRQLLAESLGKKFSLSGEIVYAGQTPIKAVGAIDQHSQIQLYREGPFDKVFTIIGVENFRNFLNIPSFFDSYDGTGYLGGHTLNELMEAERKATILALIKSQRPVIEIDLPEINPYTVGQIFYMYEVQTVFAGYLYNVNSLDQPGVEAGKQYTYGMLGRKGFEKMREEINNFPAKSKDYIL